MLTHPALWFSSWALCPPCLPSPFPFVTAHAFSRSPALYVIPPRRYAEEEFDATTCALLIARGGVVRWDLAEATQLGSDQKIWSFLGLYWGIVADVDLESEVPLFMLGGGLAAVLSLARLLPQHAWGYQACMPRALHWQCGVRRRCPAFLCLLMPPR